MRFKEHVHRAVRKVIRAFSRVKGRLSQCSPIDVVKANTKEAFEFFYSQDDFIARHYLEPARLALYKFVAGYCADILMTSNVRGTIRVADIGCGTGHMLEALRHRLLSRYDIELLGVDFASTAISKAKAMLPMATFMLEDIYENTLPSDFFDLVLSIETLEHLHRPEKALLELRRICKSGGKVVITVPNGEKDSWDGHVSFWDMAQFSKLLSPYGLVDIKLIQEDRVILAQLVKGASEAK